MRSGRRVWAVALALGAGTALAAAALVSPPGSGAPEPSLLHRGATGIAAHLETGPVAGETKEPASGLTVVRRLRPLANAGAVALEVSVRNSGSAPATCGDLALGTWVFSPGGSQGAGRYRRLEYRNDVWYGSTYWTGPDWTRVGSNWHHPGTDTPSVRRFDVPRDGMVTISGRVRKADLNGGDGVRVSVRLNAQTVWTHELEFNDGTGVEPSLRLAVRRGDALRFVVHKRGEITCDTTYWDPVVAYEGGPRCQASESFAATRQEAGGWAYEMEVDGPSAVTGPALRGLALDTGPLASACEPGRAAVLSSAQALPVFALSDAEDGSGVAVALAGRGVWSARLESDADGRLALSIAGGGLTVAPGAEVRLPTVVLASYSGKAAAGVEALDRLVAGAGCVPGGSDLADELAGACRAAGVAMRPGAGRLEIGMWNLVVADWFLEDRIDGTRERFAAAARRHLDLAGRLLLDLQAGSRQALGDEAREVVELSDALAKARPDADERSLYLKARWLKRRIALANPLLTGKRLLFCKRVPTSYSHLVMQYYGWRARPGGGIYTLDRPGYSLACRDILGGRMAQGSVLEPRLSYDAKRVVFSYVPCPPRPLTPEEVGNDGRDVGYYHVFEAGIDGSGLRQITRGAYDDLMPAYLPDGGICFSSTRRKGYARCFGPQFSNRWHVYTLHRVERDGSDLRQLSCHDTNEWFPTVSNGGQILYSRWDYIDRDAVTHQNLWATRPDGTSPIAVWGNATPAPHCAFQAQPIPGSTKIVFTASAHHSMTAGSIAIVDPSLGADGQGPVTRITPSVPFPEAEGMAIPEYYASPWPLSERYFLVSYSPYPLVWEPGANRPDAFGIYLLDVFGNRELLYRDPEIGSTSACVLAPRPAPPVLPSSLKRGASAVGEMVMQDVYRGLGDVPRGSIKALRIVQIFPKSTPIANNPPIGAAGEENGRAILGTVPVEADGSARFEVPAGKPLLFQALDESGYAYQTMRTITYVQPGERVSCVGCHERRSSSPPPSQPTFAAMRRAPSQIVAGPLGGAPFSYARTVQPVLDRSCVSCHSGAGPAGGLDLTGAPLNGYSRSYWALCGGTDFAGLGTNPQNAAKALVPRFGARNQVQVTPPGGMYGARGSRLMRLLAAGHAGVQLSREDMAALATWIDQNAIFYGVNEAEGQSRQVRGEAVAMPRLQ